MKCQRLCTLANGYTFYYLVRIPCTRTHLTFASLFVKEANIEIRKLNNTLCIIFYYSCDTCLFPFSVFVLITRVAPVSYTHLCLTNKGDARRINTSYAIARFILILSLIQISSYQQSGIFRDFTVVLLNLPSLQLWVTVLQFAIVRGMVTITVRFAWGPQAKMLLHWPDRLHGI